MEQPWRHTRDSTSGAGGDREAGALAVASGNGGDLGGGKGGYEGGRAAER